MERATLKDGSTAFFDIWNFSELREFLCSREASKGISEAYNTVKGFHYLSPTTASEIMKYGEEKYCQAKGLSPMENQEQPGLENEEYTRCPVALVDDELVGIRVCWWIKSDGNFWRYHTKFTDVREDLRNLGIARHLIRRTDSAEFLDNKILQAGSLSPDGANYLIGVLRDEIRAEKYAMIPVSYCSPKAPGKPGIYDSFGNILKGRIDERFFMY